MAEVSIERDGEIAVIVVDNPPVNAISQAVRAGLIDGVARIEADATIKAAVLLCVGRIFMSGADIRELGKPSADPQLPDVVNRIEGATKPIVVAIHGQALGGGFEIAMGCHARVALKGAKVGLPEVNLGLIPGAGGPVRLPRLINAEIAAEMVSGGAPISVEKGLEFGAIDKIVASDVRAAAIAYAKDIVASGGKITRTRDRAVRADSVPVGFFESQRKELAEKQRGRIAPVKAIDAVEIATQHDFAQASAKVREIFLSLRDSEQAQALRHLFFAERETARVPGLSDDVPRREIKSIGVIGAGAMGAGIAATFGDNGFAVTLIDVTPEQVEKGLGAIRRIYDGNVRKGRYTQADYDARMARISGGIDYAALKDVDLVVEAAFESMAVKTDVFARLDAACKPGAILATNTSYLDINEIAAATRRPGDVIGLHFFNPPNIMKLLEVVQTRDTRDDVLATCLDLGKKIGKTGVVSGVCFGFIGNRMLNAYRAEALRIALEGAPIKLIDRALYNFGMPMGPFALMDLTGLDINVKMRKEAATELIDADAFAIVDRLHGMGRLGQKTGGGFYKYEEGARRPVDDPQVDAWIGEHATSRAVARRMDIPESEIVERCLLSLANEGARILEEGVAKRASDIDVTYVTGYGFPRHVGGPMFWADQRGAETVLQRIQHYASRYGARWWKPASLFETTVKQGKSRLADL